MFWHNCKRARAERFPIRKAVVFRIEKQPETVAVSGLPGLCLCFVNMRDAGACL